MKLPNMFKSSIKKVLNHTGIEIYKKDNLPLGLDFCTDAYRKILDYNVDVIFDIGANIGQTSKYLRKFFHSSQIFAFEPVRSTYNQLVDNVAKANVICYNIGFGEQKLKTKIFLQPASSKNSLVEPLNKPVDGSGNFEEVEITTIDSFCSEHKIEKIDLLKIDTEGFGLKVLAGATQMLEQEKIKSIFIEVGFSDSDMRHDSLFKVFQYLTDYGFKLFGFYDQWIESSKLIYCNAGFTLKPVDSLYD